MEQQEKDNIINSMAQAFAEQPPEDQEEAAIVQGLSNAELHGRINMMSETYNLAKDLDPDLLREIGQEVYRGFHDDDKTRTPWLEQHTFWLSLYMQQDYSLNSDPETYWGSTESIPILTEACDMFQSRTYKVFFPNDTFVSAVPVRFTKDPEKNKLLNERAERIGRHMSYQLGVVDRSYRQNKDALFLGTAVHGSFFTKTYFSAKKKMFSVDNVRPTDLVVNYTVGPSRIEDLKRKSHIVYTTVGDTQRKVDDGYFIKPAKAGMASIENNTYNIKVDEVTGLTPSNSSLSADEPAVLIEQHVFMDIDGMYKPYIITICATSHEVLRLTIGYDADSQGNPLNDYEQQQYFTHYKYKENPDGFYGLGLGHTIGDLNSAANIMLRQIIDAATLANQGNMSGFISERLGIDGDEVKMVLGRFVKIPDAAGDLANSIWTNKFPGPNGALMTLMESIDKRAQRLGSTTESTTGTLDKVVQPTTLITQVEQALEQFSSVQMRIASSLSDELEKIYKINQKYAPLVSYFVVNDKPEAITRQDYADDMLIMPIFDPKYTTQSQKITRAQAELQATLQNPINQSRPQVIDEAFRRYFEALQVENIDALLPPQPEVQRIDDQALENVYFIMPKESRPVFDVFPEQNHMEHIKKIEELEQLSQTLGIQLPPDHLQDLFNHKLKHYGYLYGQITGATAGQVGNDVSSVDSGVPVSIKSIIDSLPAPEAELLSLQLGGLQSGGGAAGGDSVPA